MQSPVTAKAFASEPAQRLIRRIMCGLAAIFAFGPDAPPVAEAVSKCALYRYYNLLVSIYYLLVIII